MKKIHMINSRELIDDIQFHLNLCQTMEDIEACHQFFNDYLDYFSEKNKKIIINAMN